MYIEFIFHSKRAASCSRFFIFIQNDERKRTFFLVIFLGL